MQNKQDFMKTKPVFPLLLSMAAPMVLSMLIQSLYNIVDSIFVARLGTEALTAVSVAALTVFAVRHVFRFPAPQLRFICLAHLVVGCMGQLAALAMGNLHGTGPGVGGMGLVGEPVGGVDRSFDLGGGSVAPRV